MWHGCAIMAEAMVAGIGHNSGRVDAPGKSWRRYVWTKARKDLMPTLPLEVVRLRVRRAAELGLPYKTYAGIRASSGHDLIGFLFSNNALQVLREGQAMPHDRAAKIAGLVATTNTGIAPDLAGISMITRSMMLNSGIRVLVECFKGRINACMFISLQMMA